MLLALRLALCFATLVACVYATRRSFRSHRHARHAYMAGDFFTVKRLESDETFWDVVTLLAVLGNVATCCWWPW